MGITLLALYLKLNMLLAVVLLFWLVLGQLARMPGFDLGHARQLRIGRYLFLGLLAAAPLMMLGNAIMPDLLADLSAALPGTWLAGEMSVTAAIARNLDQQLTLGALSLPLGSLVLVFLASGFGVYLAWLALQIHRLRHIINGAVEWKSICNIHLLFSQQVGTPFSTRALGRRHVVLPWQLVESRRNLQLAVKHELQHLRNGDLEWVILMEGVKALCFWNPAIWLWHNAFDCLQEFACDEVLVTSRHISAHAYGNCLLDVATASRDRALPASSNMVPRFALFTDHRSQLKRRIAMLANARRSNHATPKSLAYGLFLGIGLTSASFWIFAAAAGSQPPGPNDRGEYLPTETAVPSYPATALEAKLQGWVHLEFTVDETGAVVDPVVLDNCAGTTPDTCTENDIFDASSLEALRQFEFEPRRVGGVAVATPGVQYVFRFNLAEEDSEETDADQ